MIILLGEAPTGGTEEKPFAGRVGQELFAVIDPVLTLHGLSRQDCYLTNLVKEALPENRDPLPSEIADHTPALEEELRQVRPSLVVALGRLAAEWCLGRSVIMERDYGLVYRWHRGGIPDWGHHRLPDVLVSYHPAAASHSPDIYTLFWKGLQTLKSASLTPLEDSYPAPVYQIAPERPQNALYGQREAPVGVDTEGDLQSPLGASYALTAGEGFWAPAGSHVVNIPHSVMHNALYDVPMLAKLGYTTPVYDDTMIMAHVLGEPRVGLKVLAWRHCGMSLTDYGDMIAPAREKVAVPYLSQLLSRYTPEYERRVSVKTGRDLKPRLRPPSRMYKAVARCLKHTDPYGLWHRQADDILTWAADQIGPMREPTLEDI